MEALKNVQQLVRSGISGWESMENTYSSLDIFSLTINLSFFSDDSRGTNAVRAACKEVGSVSNIIFEMRFNSDVFSPGEKNQTTYSHGRRIHSRAQSDIPVCLSIKVYYSLKLKVKRRRYRNGYWGRLRHLSSLTRYLPLYDDPLLASCNRDPCRCCETNSWQGFACLWTGGLVLPFQRGTNGRSFSQTGSSPERHQPPVSWTRDQSHQPARTCGKPETYNGVFDLQSNKPICMTESQSWPSVASLLPLSVPESGSRGDIHPLI